jgi:tetratricopeptide (TPR) repeat protein
MTTVQGADPTVIHGRPTAVGVPGAEDENDATYIVGARAPARPRTAVERPRTQPRTPSPVAVPAPAPAGRSALPYVAAGVAALAVAGGFAAWKLRSDRLPPVETTLAPAPPATLAQVIPVPPPSLAVPPPPPSTFAATGKAAGVIRAAQAAFGAGSYARAVEQAQAALQQDPGNAEARRVLDSAQKGLSAEPRLRAAEAALRAGDHAAAVREAEAAQELAPWDRRVADLLGQARNAQYQAQLAAQKTAAPPPPTVAVAPPPPPPTAGHGAHVNALLGQADTALSGSNYDAAITLYDEALKLDPSNARAVQSRSAAIAARAIAQAGKGPAGKKFVSGKTVGSSPDSVGKAPAGFEDTPGVNVQKASQASALPGKIVFDVEPDSVRPGDRYKVRVSLSNEGQAPIQIRDMIVSTRINGRGVQGPVPPLVRSVAPREKALLRELPDLWKEDTSTWVMEVVVRTARGETYKNEVSWK